MAQRGRPPKLAEIKRLTQRSPGVSAGGRRFAPPTPLASVPPVDREPVDLPPVDLPPGDLLARALHDGAAWLATTDAVAIALLRETLEERELVHEAVLAGHGDRKSLRSLDAQIVTQLSLLGLDPVARSRLGLGEVKARSRLEELAARRRGEA